MSDLHIRLLGGFSAQREPGLTVSLPAPLLPLKPPWTYGKLTSSTPMR
jgi:hypothetical protein